MHRPLFDSRSLGLPSSSKGELESYMWFPKGFWRPTAKYRHKHLRCASHEERSGIRNASACRPPGALSAFITCVLSADQAILSDWLHPFMTRPEIVAYSKGHEMVLYPSLIDDRWLIIERVWGMGTFSMRLSIRPSGTYLSGKKVWQRRPKNSA